MLQLINLKNKKTLLFFLLIFSNFIPQKSYSFNKVLFDSTINNVIVRVFDTGDGRRFYSELNFVVDNSSEAVMAILLDFPEKCNNELAKKRKVISKTFKCKYFNKNTIEAVVHRNLESIKKEEHETDRFILYTSIFNVNYYESYDLVTVSLTKKNKEKIIEIAYEMLQDNEVSKYLQIFKKKKSPFKRASGHYIIESVSALKSKLKITYISVANTWPLNADFTLKSITEGSANSLLQVMNSLNGRPESL